MNAEHLSILTRGIDSWNQWRAEHPHVKPDLTSAILRTAICRRAALNWADLRWADLSGTDLRGAQLRGARLCEASLRWADLSGAYLSGADLSAADLSGVILRTAILHRAILSKAILRRAYLSGADLRWADLGGANLSWAFLTGADLRWADLSGADLSGADLSWADLSGADLSFANLNGADLSGANLSETNLKRANLERADLSWANLGEASLPRADLTQADLGGTSLKGADLTACRVGGVSMREPDLHERRQSDLAVTPDGASEITGDNLDDATSICLPIDSARLRQASDAATSKVVLILGCFGAERRALLDAVRDELHRHGYLPVLFELDQPATSDLTETLARLARVARFVVADYTDEERLPDEVATVLANVRSVPIQPIVAASDGKRDVFEDFRSYPWVLSTYRYAGQGELVAALGQRLISVAETRARELAQLHWVEVPALMH